MLATAAMLAATLAAASPAAAEGPQRVVRTADLDLSRPEHARVLQARVAAAASQVCLPQARARSGGNYRACREETIRQALEQVNALARRKG